jgi:hypothetical protein
MVQLIAVRRIQDKWENDEPPACTHPNIEPVYEGAAAPPEFKACTVCGQMWDKYEKPE